MVWVRDTFGYYGCRAWNIVGTERRNTGILGAPYSVRFDGASLKLLDHKGHVGPVLLELLSEAKEWVQRHKRVVEALPEINDGLILSSALYASVRGGEAEDRLTQRQVRNARAAVVVGKRDARRAYMAAGWDYAEALRGSVAASPKELARLQAEVLRLAAYLTRPEGD